MDFVYRLTRAVAIIVLPAAVMSAVLVILTWIPITDPHMVRVDTGFESLRWPAANAVVGVLLAVLTLGAVVVAAMVDIGDSVGGGDVDRSMRDRVLGCLVVTVKLCAVLAGLGGVAWLVMRWTEVSERLILTAAALIGLFLWARWSPAIPERLARTAVVDRALDGPEREVLVRCAPVATAAGAVYWLIGIQTVRPWILLAVVAVAAALAVLVMNHLWRREVGLTTAPRPTAQHAAAVVVVVVTAGVVVVAATVSGVATTTQRVGHGLWYPFDAPVSDGMPGRAVAITRAGTVFGLDEERSRRAVRITAWYCHGDDAHCEKTEIRRYDEDSGQVDGLIQMYASVTETATGFAAALLDGPGEDSFSVFDCTPSDCAMPVTVPYERRSVFGGAPRLTQHPDGSLVLAYTADRVLKLTALMSGTVAETVTIVPESVHNPGPPQVVVTSDGQIVLAYQDVHDGSIHTTVCADIICRAPRTARITAPGHGHAPPALSIGPDGMPMLATVDPAYAEVVLYDCEDVDCTRQRVRRLAKWDWYENRFAVSGDTLLGRSWLQLVVSPEGFPTVAVWRYFIHRGFLSRSDYSVDTTATLFTCAEKRCDA
ncbi:MULTISPECIES: hypothetical protein [unclassified Nocardia]|uniref:hypothetical protein n=1 Tax=unclassified Nocardia TaxID=2637762 RepID=UPI00278C1DB9|nr:MULTISPECIES: hypothetical protein [unclassified Nocardia]